jgi:hypothetical protein
MSLPTKRPYLFLFLLICCCSLIGVTLGWIVGFIAGANDSGIGAVLGGILGGIIGTLISERWNLVSEWDRILVVLPTAGFCACSGIAQGYNLPGIIAIFCGVIGSGFGGMVAKYVMEFFDEDPPITIV